MPAAMILGNTSQGAVQGTAQDVAQDVAEDVAQTAASRAGFKGLLGRLEAGALAKPLRFVGLSGIGWLLDTGVYMLLVGGFGLRVFVAAMIGGLCGASFAFLTSSRWVFAGRRHGLGGRLAVYLVYTAMQIVVMSAVIDGLAAGLQAGLARVELAISWPLVALLSKCLITPVLLAMNYFVARKLSGGA
jgi:putative flippase GtrA